MPGVIEIIQGDITKIPADAIANAANEALLGGGGVDGAIHRAAGPQLLEECRALPEITPGVRCPTGQAKVTRAYGLPARFVIHTVGPVWQGGKKGEEEMLELCYRSVLRLAAAMNCASVSIPAISTGVYGFPVEKAARIAVAQTREFLTRESSVEQVLLVCYDADTKRHFDRALASSTASDE